MDVEPEVAFRDDMYGGTQLFPVDNLIYPDQTLPLTPSGGMELNAQTGSLAFNDPTFPGLGGSGVAFLIYANKSGGVGEYGVAFNGAGNQPYLNNYDGGTVCLSLSAVPQPTTKIGGALMLLPFGASTVLCGSGRCRNAHSEAICHVPIVYKDGPKYGRGNLRGVV